MRWNALPTARRWSLLLPTCGALIACGLIACGSQEEGPRHRAAQVVTRDAAQARDAGGADERSTLEQRRRDEAVARLDQLRLVGDPKLRETRLRSPKPEGPRATFIAVKPLLAKDFDGSALVHVDLALSADDVATRAAFTAAERAASTPGSPSDTPSLAVDGAGAERSASTTSAGPNVSAAAPTETPTKGVDDACAGLDLSVLAERAPRLVSLRVSGCREALHAGLGTFGAKLQTLELADVELDDVLLDRIRQLSGLRALTLTRVRIGSVTPEALRAFGRGVAIEHLVLRDLEHDSLIGDLLGDVSTLQVVQLEGAWAGHRAMTSLSKAKRVEALGLVDTNVGNFSLNQIESLSKLREVEWVGTTFNDYSPLHLRDLPIERFRCSCARFGDAGVRHLAYLPRLQTLALSQGRFQARALERLADLAALERLELMDVTLDEPDLAAIARLSRLRVLVLDNATLVAPEAPHLGELTTLRELHVDLEGFGDRAAPSLATLTALEVLDLGAAPLSDDAVSALAPLASLRVLLLHGSRVTNRGLQTLGELTNLERLDLDHTDVVDAGVARLVGLQRLRSLRLDHTLVTDAALVSLAKLVELRELDLSYTVVTDAGVAALAPLPSLETLVLTGTRASTPRIARPSRAPGAADTADTTAEPVVTRPHEPTLDDDGDHARAPDAADGVTPAPADAAPSLPGAAGTPVDDTPRAPG